MKNADAVQKVIHTMKSRSQKVKTPSSPAVRYVFSAVFRSNGTANVIFLYNVVDVEPAVTRLKGPISVAPFMMYMVLESRDIIQNNDLLLWSYGFEHEVE